MDDVIRILTDRLIHTAEALGTSRAMAEALRDKLDTMQYPKPLDGSAVVRLLDYMAENKKIEAIKLYREITGYGLTESKDAVCNAMRGG